MRNLFNKTDILFCTAGITAIVILATSSVPSLTAGALITLVLLALRYVSVYTFTALALLLLPYLIVCFPFAVPAAIGLFIAVAALKACYLLFKRYDIFSAPAIALKEVYMYIEEVYTALKVAFTSVKSAFSDGRALDLFKRDILLPLENVLSDNRVLNLVKHNVLSPLEDIYTALKVAFTSVKSAFSDGRALDLFKRDILSPLENVPTALTNTEWSLVESLRQQVKVFAKILM
ncbi:hypothetical protein [Wolbachia endosymbiont (group B) of Pammene fasciana]|uniref:hypothetical protein n=1 Tax=Wolbachia endosymbiont (group B) of Pammene fasciana TaxID=2954037 RepID=UPI002230C182|nr:hypothetical protein [Wolbachia endosymbiont (group B) of Pammene fasciana]